MNNKRTYRRLTISFTEKQYEYMRKAAEINESSKADIIRGLVNKEFGQKQSRIKKVTNSLFVRIFHNANNRK